MEGEYLNDQGDHLIHREWTFWEHIKMAKGGSSKGYGNSMVRLGNFDTVEGFWQNFNNMPKPSEILYTHEGWKKFEDREIEAFSLFAKGIRPEWEDEKNSKGGEFRIQLNKTDPNDLDDSWLHLCMGLIGEMIDPNNTMCGIRVIDRSKNRNPTYRFEIWFSDPEEKQKIRQNVEDCLRELNIQQHYKFDYKSHGKMY